MSVKVTGVENIGEALQVTGEVDGKVVSVTVKSKLMFDYPEIGVLNLLERIASQPPVEEVKGEVVKGEVITAERVPDAARVAAVKALEVSVKSRALPSTGVEVGEVEVRK